MIPEVLRLAIRADRRTPEQVRKDIYDEFAHHAACLGNELATDAVNPADLARRVAERFGETSHYARECESIALRERRMLQRVNLILLVVVTVAVAWMAVANRRAASENALAVRALAARLEAMTPPASGTGVTDAAAVRAGPVSSVLIKGRVERPGLYAIPADGTLTLRRVLVAAGFERDGWTSPAGAIRVSRFNGSDRNTVVFDLARDEYDNPQGRDMVLRPGDLVEVP